MLSIVFKYVLIQAVAVCGPATGNSVVLALQQKPVGTFATDKRSVSHPSSLMLLKNQVATLPSAPVPVVSPGRPGAEGSTCWSGAVCKGGGRRAGVVWKCTGMV